MSPWLLGTKWHLWDTVQNMRGDLPPALTINGRRLPPGGCELRGTSALSCLWAEGCPQQRVGEPLVSATGCHRQPGQGGVPRGHGRTPRASAALCHGLASSCTGLWRGGQGPLVTGGPSSLHHTAAGTSEVLSLPTCPFPGQFSGYISISQPLHC